MPWSSSILGYLKEIPFADSIRPEPAEASSAVLCSAVTMGSQGLRQTLPLVQGWCRCWALLMGGCSTSRAAIDSWQNG